MLQERVQFTAITPEMAKKMLENNAKNRRIDQNRVNAYVEAMLAGEWKCDQNTFAIYEDGNIADGQHRLMAIWLGGITLDNCMIIHGVKNDSLFDVGQQRTTAQNLAIRGELGEVKNINTLVGIANYILTYNRSEHKKNDYVIENFLKKYRYPLDVVMRSLCAKKVPRISIAPVAAAFVVALISGVPCDMIEGMCESLVSGVALESYKLPIIALRNRLLQSSNQSNSKLSRDEKFLMTQRVISAVISHENLRIVKAVSKPIWVIEEMKKAGGFA